MRHLSVSAITLLACLAAAGCRSNSSPESVLAVGPSNETTSAVNRSTGPIPAASVGGTNVGYASPGEPVANAEALAWAGPGPDADAFGQVTPAPSAATPTMRPTQVASISPALSSGRQIKSQVYSQRFRDAKPINFGKVTPQHFPVHGVDVSRWQGDIDWAKLRTQGANFAFIKATDGGDHLDPMFKTNWRQAREAGVRRGAYHFFYWCRVASEQADWFIRNVPKEPGALPPVIDVEYNHQSDCKRRLTPALVREKMQVFMDRLERHYGQRPIIYTAPDFYEDNLQGAFQDYPFWLRSVAAHPSKRYPNRKWLFWQYSGSGLSQGVGEKIDLNVFRGNEKDWHKWLASRAG